MAEQAKKPADSEDQGAARESAAAAASRMDSAYYSVIGRTTADGRVMIGRDAEILPSQERKDLASPGTRAYEVKDAQAGAGHFALICGRGTVPRVMAASSYKSLKSPHLLQLIDAGVVDWGPERRQRYAFIFEKPVGKKLLASPEAMPLAIPEGRLVSALIEPAVAVLAAFHSSGLIHGAINAENIYLSGAEGAERIMLGECLSSAPSLWQHPLYESVPRAMAQPSGRGPGTIKDDLYALGMCVAMLTRGANLTLGKSSEQIIQEKVEHGSYGAVIGREHIPGGISEFLRGVLNDDDAQRWDLDDVQRWIEGRRLTPKPTRFSLKASRPLLFRERKHWDLRSLAEAFAADPAEAALEIEKDHFDLWLKRNFDDKGLKARLDGVWQKDKTGPRERLISSLCLALDPYGPVRYKGLSVFPAGVGVALARAMADNEDLHPYADLLQQQLLSAWVSQIFEEVPDASSIMGTLEKCRNALGQRMPGYGMERILYLLNPDVACLSPLFKDHFVLSAGNLLLALEDLAQHSSRPEMILDRHMIAYISVRETRIIDPYLGHINSANKGHQIIGIIRALAAIQRRFSIGNLPGVCNWLISLTGPAIEMFNDRDLRQEMSRRINRLKDSGQIMALLTLLADPATVSRDAHAFAAARQTYRALAAEKGGIEGQLRLRQNVGRDTGRQIAMFLSSILATVAIVTYLVLRLAQKLF